MARRYYSKEQFTAYARQQIIENNDLIKGFEIICEVLPKFDGKVTNARLKTAVDTALKTKFRSAYFNFDLLNGYSRFNLAVRDNDSYQVPGNGMYSGTNYTDYESSAYVQECDNKRLDATKTIESINKHIETLKKENIVLLYESTNIDEIEKEYNAIKKQIDQFNEKYSYEIRNLYSFR